MGVLGACHIPHGIVYVCIVHSTQDLMCPVELRLCMFTTRTYVRQIA
jgi:hypothetical protein